MPALGWWQSVKVVQLNIITCCSVSDRLSMCQLRGKYGIYQLIHPRIKYRHHVNWQVTSLLDRGIVNIPVSQEALSSIKEQRCFHQLRPCSAMNKIRAINLPRIFYATKNRRKCLTLAWLVQLLRTRSFQSSTNLRPAPFPVYSIHNRHRNNFGDRWKQIPWNNKKSFSSLWFLFDMECLLIVRWSVFTP